MLFDLKNLTLFLPELIVIATLAVVLVVDLLARQERGNASLMAGLLGIVGALLALGWTTHFQDQLYFWGMLSADGFSHFFRLFFLVVAAVALCYGYQSNEVGLDRKGEFYLLILAVTLGMMLLVSSTHLLLLYLSLELISILSYVLAGFQIKDRFANEAALKYTLFGAVASGMMLYGISLLYGFTGSLHFADLQTFLSAAATSGATSNSMLFILTVILLLAGFGFKMTMVPMHLWSPDVYEGAPTPSAAFFTVAPKAAGFAAFIRFFYTVLAQPSLPSEVWVTLAGLDWSKLLAILSALTMTLGNLSALRQTSAKRLLAYSSIAHAGYILMGFAVLSADGLRAVMFYFIVYYLMNFGAFMIVGLLSESLGGEEIDRFSGLGKTAPFAAVVLTIFLLSLTGIPPFAGFIGKVYLFAAVVRGELYWLALVGVINSVISLYYYARLVRAMFLVKEPAVLTLAPLPFVMRGVLMILCVPTLLFGIYWEPVIRFAAHSLRLFVR